MFCGHATALDEFLEAEWKIVRTAEKYELHTEIWDNYLYKMLEA